VWVQPARRIATTRHVRWDGTGDYQLVAREIPLASRIVALGDGFDALTHERPYKSAWPVDMAVDEIHQCRGTHFDPAVVDAFDTLNPEDLVNPAESVAGAGGWSERVGSELAAIRLAVAR